MLRNWNITFVCFLKIVQITDSFSPFSSTTTSPQAKVVFKTAFHGSYSAFFSFSNIGTRILYRFVPAAADAPAENVDKFAAALWSFVFPSTLEHPGAATAWCNEKNFIQ